MDAVIVGAVRTPVGRRKGGLAGVHPVDLSAHVLRALAERTGLDPADVDDVVWGCVSQVGEQSWNVGRNAVLAAGWPESVPGTTLDRQCGSSQQALHFAAAAVLSGQADLVVAGGVESMTRVPMGSSVGRRPTPFGDQVRDRYRGRRGLRRRRAGAVQPGRRRGADRRSAGGLSRAQLDEFALASHEKAAAAQDAGAFEPEIAPVAAADGGKFTADEGIRRDTTLARLGRAGDPVPADGVVTAGSASQISDGAAALAVTTREWARRHGLRPLARIHTAVVAADDPVAHAHRADPGHREGAAPRRAGHRGDRGVRGQRGVRPGAAGLAGRDGGGSGAAQPARRGDRARATRSAAPAPGS